MRQYPEYVLDHLQNLINSPKVDNLIISQISRMGLKTVLRQLVVQVTVGEFLGFITYFTRRSAKYVTIFTSQFWDEQYLSYSLITSHAGVVQSIVMSTSVCVCTRMSVREDISRTFSKFLCMLPMAVARSSSSRVTKSQGEGAVLGVFFPTDNALYSIAFVTNIKTAEPIEMPFGLHGHQQCQNTEVNASHNANQQYQSTLQRG